MSWDDGGTEAEYLQDHDDFSWEEDDDYDSWQERNTSIHEPSYLPKINPRKGSKRVDNSNRFRCLSSGCNPILYGEDQAAGHRQETGHRTAKWPVRSSEGERKARIRNKTGYYDKYNVGEKSYFAREHLI